MNNTSISAFLSAIIFGLGLGISGMTDANKVISFLTLDSNWDPSLMFVMGGAIAVHALLYQFILKRESPLFNLQFHIPTRTDITPRLLVGSVLFGTGWAIGGVCPGPGIVSVASGEMGMFLFVAGLFSGMALFNTVGVKVFEQKVQKEGKGRLV
jgi:uncharacterized protein